MPLSLPPQKSVPALIKPLNHLLHNNQCIIYAPNFAEESRSNVRHQLEHDLQNSQYAFIMIQSKDKSNMTAAIITDTDLPKRIINKYHHKFNATYFTPVTIDLQNVDLQTFFSEWLTADFKNQSATTPIIQATINDDLAQSIIVLFLEALKSRPSLIISNLELEAKS